MTDNNILSSIIDEISPAGNFRTSNNNNQQKTDSRTEANNRIQTKYGKDTEVFKAFGFVARLKLAGKSADELIGKIFPDWCHRPQNPKGTIIDVIATANGRYSYVVVSNHFQLVN